MRNIARRMRRMYAFTLIELMIVVTIVAILALVAIPLYTAQTTSAVMSEGVAGAGAIRSSLRTYAATHNGDYSNGGNAPTTLAEIGMNNADLDGKYFAGGDYSFSVTSASHYTITVAAPTHKPSITDTYIINQDGAESGTYTTGQ